MLLHPSNDADCMEIQTVWEVVFFELLDLLNATDLPYYRPD